jgi:hypothetical protein
MPAILHRVAGRSGFGRRIDGHVGQQLPERCDRLGRGLRTTPGVPPSRPGAIVDKPYRLSSLFSMIAVHLARRQYVDLCRVASGLCPAAG